jgi:peptidase M15-like protein
MIVLIRNDWRSVELTKGITLRACVVSKRYPQLAAAIIPTEEQVENAYRLAVLFFRPLMNRFGETVFTSWIRDYALNKAVGGVANSGHMLGSASDFACPNAKNGMLEVYDFCQNEIDWPGELFYYSNSKSCHVDLPRLNIDNDHGVFHK